MEFKIPFAFSNPKVLKKKVKNSAKSFRGLKNSKIEKELKNARVDLSTAEYFAIAFRTLLISFFSLLIISNLILFILRIEKFFLFGLGISMVFSLFIFVRQISYPKMYSSRKEKEIEKDLISVMQDMLVQLNSGVPIYEILNNIATSDYGEVSKEINCAVSEINSGVNHIDALENLINKNNSEYFKRVLWQISNGLRSGSDMEIVLKDSIDNLNKEQGIQIQTYGNKLNPLVMFYMLIAVIIPALGLTFLIILSSMLNLDSQIVQMLFVGIGLFIVLTQVMFLGLIKTKRPSLL